jgi:hypothetical protein
LDDDVSEEMPGMIWATRRFAAADYAPYQDRLDELMWANTQLHERFMMVSVETDRERGMNDIYVGVPTSVFLAQFDGFRIIPEEELPEEIDALLIGTISEFKSHFRFRQDQR